MKREKMMDDSSAKAETDEQREAHEQALFVAMFNKQQSNVHNTARDKGWWNKSGDYETAARFIAQSSRALGQQVALEALNNLSKRNDAEMIALMHSELSEALEALRHGNPPDDKCPEFSGVTVELADVLIRMMDFAEHHKLPLARAVIAKMEMNRGRSHKHGGKAF
jgi:NTP pyrophosphatase (non-canonical NTP hydrolase)